MDGKTQRLLGFALGLILLAVAGLLFSRYRRHPLTLIGVVNVKDADPRKELPIPDTVVSVPANMAPQAGKSDASGYFSLRLFKRIRPGDRITITFRHPGYQPLDLKEIADDKLYIAHMQPIRPRAEAGSKKPAVMIGNVVVRYSFKTLRTVNVGSAVKTFEVTNTPNVPCNGNPICSPDGRWKATVGSVELDAGAGNEFRDARLSCIAGPCPFTQVELDNFSKGGQKISASVRNWADTTTFLVEAEVTKLMVSQVEHRSYPVIFGPALNFTLPADAEGVTLEADYAGESIIFPLGPELLLSWANCSASVDQNKTKAYRCQLKPGYEFRP